MMTESKEAGAKCPQLIWFLYSKNREVVESHSYKTNLPCGVSGPGQHEYGAFTEDGVEGQHPHQNEIGGHTQSKKTLLGLLKGCD